MSLTWLFNLLYTSLLSEHYKGQHFIIPEMSDSSLDMSELAKQAKKKLQQVGDKLYYPVMHHFSMLYP